MLIFADNLSVTDRHVHERRELRSCHPRDIRGRLHDICRNPTRPLVLTQELLARAWVDYFGK